MNTSTTASVCLLAQQLQGSRRAVSPSQSSARQAARPQIPSPVAQTPAAIFLPSLLLSHVQAVPEPLNHHSTSAFVQAYVL